MILKLTAEELALVALALKERAWIVGSSGDPAGRRLADQCRALRHRLKAEAKLQGETDDQ